MPERRAAEPGRWHQPAPPVRQAVRDAAGGIVFLGRRGEEGQGDGDIVRGLQITPVGERACASTARAVVGARLGGSSGECHIAPLGRDCCGVFGNPLETRLWGLFARLDTDLPNLGYSGAVVMTDPARTTPKPSTAGMSCYAVGPD